MTSSKYNLCKASYVEIICKDTGIIVMHILTDTHAHTHTHTHMYTYTHIQLCTYHLQQCEAPDKQMVNII